MTEEQTRHFYKKVELGSKINVDTMKQDINNDKLTGTKTSEEEEINPYQKVVLNNMCRDETKTAQIEYSSILSDNVKYIQHDEESEALHDLDIETLNYRHHKKLYNKLKGEERQTLDMDFGDNSHVLKTNYLDMYEGVHVEIVYSSRFDEWSDMTMTYLDRTRMMRATKVKAEEKFSISGQGYILGKLLDDTDCQILLYVGASKSYISRLFYLKCKTLYMLPKFASNTQRIQVGNGQYVGVLFIMPVTVHIHGHRFEIFTLVLEIHENIALVLGIKNVLSWKVL